MLKYVLLLFISNHLLAQTKENDLAHELINKYVLCDHAWDAMWSAYYNDADIAEHNAAGKEKDACFALASSQVLDDVVQGKLNCVDADKKLSQTLFHYNYDTYPLNCQISLEPKLCHEKLISVCEDYLQKHPPIKK